MKSTDIARRDREIKRQQKKEEYLERRQTQSAKTVGDYIKELHGYFFFDAEKIYNIEMSEEIMILLDEMKVDIPEKQWDNIIRKAVRETKVKQKEEAIELLKLVAEIE